MKNLIKREHFALYILLTAVLIALSSCGTESVQISKEEPFIVSKITLEDGMYKYEREKFERPFKEFFAMEKQSITLDYDIGVAVGDTLHLYCR